MKYWRSYAFYVIHGRCVSRKPFNPDNHELNLTWWGRLLHIHIDKYPRLRKALLRWL